MKIHALLTFCFVLGTSTSARSQCLDWDAGFHLPGTNQEVRCMTTFGGTPGAPELFIGGGFTRVDNQNIRGLARFDGTSWRAFGPVGVGDANPGVSSMTVWDDGSGLALYISGTFTNVNGVPATNIARWDGVQWTSLGLGLGSGALCMKGFNDGSGPALYVGGDFLSAGGNTAYRIARWNGTAWSMPAVNGSNSGVEALEVFDDGTGPALYAGGGFTYLDGTTKFLSKWNGTTWTAMPGNMNGVVRALKAWQGGPNNGLYACGWFTQIQGSAYGVARWNGTSWSEVGGGITVSTGLCDPRALEVFDDGAGLALYVTGYFSHGAGVPMPGIARWNTGNWQTLGTGLTLGANPQGGTCLTVRNEPSGAKLVAGGVFTNAGGVAVSGLATWRSGWSSLGSGAGVNGLVNAVSRHDDGSGPATYVAGAFSAAAGSAGVNTIGRWNGTNLVPVGAGAAGPITALVSFTDGGGPKLFAVGDFFSMDGVAANRLAMWNGTAWSSASNGVTWPTKLELIVYDDGTGPGLYSWNSLQKWNGTSWVASNWNCPLVIRAATVVQETSGTKLYVSGTRNMVTFTDRRCAVFDGVNWTLLPGVFDSEPTRICSYNDGSGPALHVFRNFSTIDSVAFGSAAKWNGSAWVPLGAGLVGTAPGTPGDVLSTAVSTGAGSRLYVAGAISQAGGTPVQNIAMWDGTAWHEVAGGLDGQVQSLCSFVEGGRSELWVGGGFSKAGTQQASRLARYIYACPITGFCFGDGSGAACPCLNGTAGNGCPSSVSPGGGRLTATGTPSIAADSLVLTNTLVPNGPGLYYQGSGITAIPFGDGVLCAGSGIVRLGVVFAAGSTSSYPGGLTPGPVSVMGFNVAGNVRHYQTWYRDSFPFCTPALFNLTSGVTVTWSP